MWKQIDDLKNSVQHLWDKFLDREDDHITSKKVEVHEYESHRLDRNPISLEEAEGSGVKYNTTENSELANGAPKADAVGIDSFGEEKLMTPDEADDHQDYRNRKHSSDLSDRYLS